MYKILRRGSGRVFVLCIVVLSLLLCLYYVSQVQAPSTGHPAAAILNEELRYDRSLTSATPDYSESPDAQVSLATCPVIVARLADIDAQQEFSTFDFQVTFEPIPVVVASRDSLASFLPDRAFGNAAGRCVRFLRGRARERERDEITFHPLGDRGSSILTALPRGISGLKINPSARDYLWHTRRRDIYVRESSRGMYELNFIAMPHGRSPVVLKVPRVISRGTFLREGGNLVI